MPIGNTLDARDRFRMALGHYYKIERDRTERCLADIVEILGDAREESAQVQSVLDRLIAHYARTP